MVLRVLLRNFLRCPKSFKMLLCSCYGALDDCKIVASMFRVFAMQLLKCYEGFCCCAIAGVFCLLRGFLGITMQILRCSG